MKGVNIFLADGFEETEALATLDVLRRGDVEVKTVSVSGKEYVKSSHGVTVLADVMLADVLKQSCGTPNENDIMIFPGGMPGSKTLASTKELIDSMNNHYSNGGTVAAICAAPGLVLSQLAEDIKGKQMTCFDGFETSFVERGADHVKKPAVRDGRIITGRGAGLAIDFGLEILTFLKGKEAANKVRASMMLPTIL